MVRDRLAEFQALSRGEDSPAKAKKKDAKPLLSPDEELTESLAFVSKIDDRIKKMKDEVEDMGKLQKTILGNPMIDKKEVQKLDQTSDKVFNASSQIQKEINTYRTELPSLNMESAHEEIIKKHLTRLSGDVTRTMNDFRAAQMDYIEKTQKLHNKKVEIVTGKESGASGASVDTNNMQAVFAGDYLMEAEKAKLQLREIEARDLEIKKIEGSVIEVNRLFKEINALVMEQSEVIDVIEKHVNMAEVDVESGRGDLKKAKDNLDSARRKKFCCIGILVAILIIAAIIITMVIVSSNNN